MGWETLVYKCFITNHPHGKRNYESCKIVGMLSYISNTAHYKEVLSRVKSVKHTLWIGTADIKDLYVEVGKEEKHSWHSLPNSFGAVWK